MSETEKPLEDILAEMHQKMLESQTNLEPELAAAVFKERSKLYTIFPTEKDSGDGRG